MTFKKSMISIAAASLLAAGLTGCTGGDESGASVTTTDNDGIVTQINTPKGTVTGTVMDTNGNPLSGVNVYVAGMTTTTDAGGVYTFADVPVTNTSTDGANATGHNALSVTISAPEGFLGATVLVAPQAQLDHSNDGDDATAGDTDAVSNTTFIDGYIAQAGTAVLPALNSTVSGKLENAATEAPVANQEITLDFLNVGVVGANVAQAQNGVATSYATGNYTTTTDANGNFTIANVPSDADLTYVVPNFTVNGEEVVQGTNAVTVTTNAETSVVNVGDVQVTPVVNEDNAAPMVASVNGVIDGTVATAMLEDDVRNTFTINFSEPMNMEVDTDLTDSVIVKAGSTRASMGDVDATATLGTDGQSVVVTVPSDLADNTLVDINLLITDFKDAAGNFLGLNPAAALAYDSIPQAQVVRLQLQIFNDLNTTAPAVESVAQQTVDANGATNDASTLQTANIAFNDVVDSGTPDNTISQMNAADDDNGDLTADADARLTALGTAALGAGVTMLTDVPRVTFTPSGAAGYQVNVTRNGAETVFDNADVAIQGGATVAAVADIAGTVDIDNADGDNDTTTGVDVSSITITPVDAGSVNPIEFTIATATVQVGDVLTITPLDDLGYVGTATTITLADNVAPTTVLQRSYGLGNVTNANNTVVKFGDAGELSDTAGEVTVGTPYLAVTAGLLDNLKADGTAVNGLTASDNALTEELYAHNTVNATTGNAYINKATGMYDTVAWAAFNTDASLARTIGVAFSEDVSLNGVTPASTNVTATLSNWKENNDVVVNDDTGVVNADLIDFTASNVMTLANYDGQRAGVIDFTGIADNAGNVATAEANAKVIVLDKMPPFVTEASFDGTNVTIKFNEALRDLEAGDTISITSAAAATRTATYAVANAAKYTLSADKMTLTIDSGEFAGLTKADFDFGAYIETPYGTTEKQHAALTWTVADTYGNEWTNENAGVTAPMFAIAELIGEFKHTTSAVGFTTTAATNVDAQTVVWTFTHPIRVDAAGDIFNTTTDTVNADSSISKTAAATMALFQTNDLNADGSVDNDLITNADAANPTVATLSADRKTLTLVFTTEADVANTTDYVRLVAGNTLTSATDTAQVITGISLSANAKQ